MKPKPEDLTEVLRRLSLTTIAQHYEDLGREAAREGLGHVEYLRRLAEAEAAARYERSVQRRTKAARLPVLKTLEQFDWSWPKQDQPRAGPGPLPPALHRAEHQRRVHRRRRPGQDSSGRRAGAQRLPAQRADALRPGRGDRQHALGRPGDQHLVQGPESLRRATTSC